MKTEQASVTKFSQACSRTSGDLSREELPGVLWIGILPGGECPTICQIVARSGYRTIGLQPRLRTIWANSRTLPNSPAVSLTRLYFRHRRACRRRFTLLDSHSHGVAGLSVYGQSQIDIAAPGQRRRQPHIALIQANKIALLTCIQHFRR